MNTDDLDTQPWHQQFWPWFLIALPAIAVVASFWMLYISINNAPDLVVKDYDRIGEISLQQMARDKQAADLGLSATLNFSPSRRDGYNLVSIALSSGDNNGLPAFVTLSSFHSTLASMDSETRLEGGNGHYAGEVPKLTGAYNLSLADPAQTWKLSARVSGQPEQVKLESFRVGSDAIR